jgi:hypothetical protein
VPSRKAFKKYIIISFDSFHLTLKDDLICQSQNTIPYWAMKKIKIFSPTIEYIAQSRSSKVFTKNEEVNERQETRGSLKLMNSFHFLKHMNFV